MKHYTFSYNPEIDGRQLTLTETSTVSPEYIRDDVLDPRHSVYVQELGGQSTLELRFTPVDSNSWPTSFEIMGLSRHIVAKVVDYDGRPETTLSVVEAIMAVNHHLQQEELADNPVDFL